MDQDNKLKKPVQVSKLDPKFRSEVLKHKSAGGLNACFSCGTCTAGCPISEVFPEYNPKKFAKMVKLGMRRDVLSSRFIWYCTTCHTCEQHCPQNVEFFNILNVLKNMAAKQGYAPSPWVEQTQQIMRTGLIFPTDEELVKKRESLSLSVLKSDGTKAKRLIQFTGIAKIKAQRKS
jgi:heterodisulfide reductase subunit C